MSCLIDTETLIRWKKSTTWGPDCNHDIKSATIPRICLKDTGTDQPWKWRLTVLKIIRMMLVRPLHTFKLAVRDSCAFSTCNPLPLPIKALTHWFSVRGNLPLDRSQHSSLHRSCQHLIQSKISFPPTWLLNQILSSEQPDHPHF